MIAIQFLEQSASGITNLDQQCSVPVQMTLERMCGQKSMKIVCVMPFDLIFDTPLMWTERIVVALRLTATTNWDVLMFLCQNMC